MADASRLRRRSKSASGTGVEDSAGVLEAEGFLDIAELVVAEQIRAVERERPTAR